MKMVMNFFFRSRRARFSAAVRLRFGRAFLRFSLAFGHGYPTLRDHYSSEYCGGDLPTRLMMRG